MTEPSVFGASEENERPTCSHCGTPMVKALFSKGMGTEDRPFKFKKMWNCLNCGNMVRRELGLSEDKDDSD